MRLGMAIDEAEVDAEEGNGSRSNCHGDRRVKKRKRDEDEKEDEEERTRNEEEALEAASLGGSTTICSPFTIVQQRQRQNTS